jgi:hypothetical protein
MTKRKEGIYIVPFERGYEVKRLDIDTLKNPIILSDAFWQHFTSTFPSATIGLFTDNLQEYNSQLQLTDSTYSFGLISDRNRIFFLNHLPKNLTKEESNSYREGLGFFILPDSTDTSEPHKPEVTLERHWSKASKEVETEYLRFYSFVVDHERQYALVAKKALIDSILMKYQ